jgi:phospholipid/cholesterol/gamma-HCH transport system substrate-binding protein
MNRLHFKVGLFAAASLLLAGVFLVYLLHAQIGRASCRERVS